jgi:hypothetical protein
MLRFRQLSYASTLVVMFSRSSKATMQLREAESHSLANSIEVRQQVGVDCR